ncbi:MAG: MFS transporter, partial [Dehalococcoidia bacterium]|nr:MFS transporter [Dehalococcoidia bacterium]
HCRSATTCFGYTVVGVALRDIKVPSRSAGSAFKSTAGFTAAFSLMKIPAVRVSLLLSFVRLWLFAGWQPFFTLYLEDHDFSPILIGTIPAATYAVAIVANLFIGPISRLGSKEVVTAASLAIGALGTALSTHLAIIPLVYAPVALLGFANGVTLPLLIAMVSDNAPPGQRGVALGLRNSVNDGASVVAPLILGLMIPAMGIPLGFAVGAVFMWSTLGVSMRMLRANQSPAVVESAERPT